MPNLIRTTKDIRSTFLDFFAGKDHHIMASSPLVPGNDPSLLFTNSGMVQFKNIFTGHETPAFKRAVTAQKCVRAGGKHNDLENVGYTARHHTFFEMLGNFSFGDYFKETAIELAWRFIRHELGLPAERLLVTVYHEDEEAVGHWRKIAGLPDERIIRITSQDNFWQMGDTGPCGPCSEIFYDHGEEIEGGPPGSADEDGDRFVEIWNLVFMQYDRKEDGTLDPLPQPSIDTGMGLERIATVLQGKYNNFDIDLFSSLIKAIPISDGSQKAGTEGDKSDAAGLLASQRIIADHLRSCSFLIADGVFPGNEGRGYVLRRIMRRAIRHARKLGHEEAMIHRLVPSLIAEMGGHYRELGRAEALITETWRDEENRFRKTLAHGLKVLGDKLEEIPKTASFPGEIAFKLYDTYGFPLDLTGDILREQGRDIDISAFDREMEKQRAKARQSWTGSGEQASQAVFLSLRDKLGPTEFNGYAAEKSEALITGLICDDKAVSLLKDGEEGMIILNQTVFYGESGGQIGDSGLIWSSEYSNQASSSTPSACFKVFDTRKPAKGLFCHIGRAEGGDFTLGDAVGLEVDRTKRQALRRHHSATHLLHAALREILGSHVTQKGSRINEESLRFDFTHSGPLTAEVLNQIEMLVNSHILENSPVSTRIMPVEEAIEAGAMALFGEKYDEEVRVVRMGEKESAHQTADIQTADIFSNAFSIELCGGTHIAHLGSIGSFVILSESAAASGVRRIEACCGLSALAWSQKSRHLVDKMAGRLKTNAEALPARLESLLEERQKSDRALKESRLKNTESDDSIKPIKLGGTNLILRQLPETSPKDLKPMADYIGQKFHPAVIALVAPWEGKASLVIALKGDVDKKIDAVLLAKAGAGALGGLAGGGRRDMAQAGGPDISRLAESLEDVKSALEAMVK